MKTVDSWNRVSSLSDVPEAALESCRDGAAAGRDGVIEVRVGVPALDPLAWLANQPRGERLYWSSRDELSAAAAVGVCHQVRIDRPFDYSTLTGLLGPDHCYYGGLRFDPSIPDTDASWRRFGHACFTMPRLEVNNRAGKCSVALRFHSDEDTTEAAIGRVLERFSWTAAGSFATPPSIDSISESPDQSGWSRSVDSALRRIGGGEIQKVVLSRRQSLSLVELADPVDVLSSLRSHAPDCFHFLFESGPYAFLGASPELLYRRDGCSITSEAMAGTRLRGKDAGEDRILGEQLLGSDKDRREHHYVAEFITRALRRLCRQLGANGCARTELRRLQLVQHLVARFEGELDAGVTDAHILEALHPTPAVGGLPRSEALSFIAATEEFDRGWYGGPVGRIRSDGAEMAVGIRSMLLKPERTAVLFGGCGLVEGSTASGEWEETAAKLAGLRSVFEDHE